MKSLSTAALAMLLAGLAACERPVASPTSERGRYVGVGIYAARDGWAKIAAERSRPGVAGVADDDHVIVVLDNQTGEVRQCGDLSGHCIGMNPRAKPLTAASTTPLNLSPPPAETPEAP